MHSKVLQAPLKGGVVDFFFLGGTMGLVIHHVRERPAIQINIVITTIIDCYILLSVQNKPKEGTHLIVPSHLSMN